MTDATSNLRRPARRHLRRAAALLLVGGFLAGGLRAMAAAAPAPFTVWLFNQENTPRSAGWDDARPALAADALPDGMDYASNYGLYAPVTNEPSARNILSPHLVERVARAHAGAFAHRGDLRLRVRVFDWSEVYKVSTALLDSVVPDAGDNLVPGERPDAFQVGTTLWRDLRARGVVRRLPAAEGGALRETQTAWPPFQRWEDDPAMLSAATLFCLDYHFLAWAADEPGSANRHGHVARFGVDAQSRREGFLRDLRGFRKVGGIATPENQRLASDMVFHLLVVLASAESYTDEDGMVAAPSARYEENFLSRCAREIGSFMDAAQSREVRSFEHSLEALPVLRHGGGMAVLRYPGDFAEMRGYHLLGTAPASPDSFPVGAVTGSVVFAGGSLLALHRDTAPRGIAAPEAARFLVAGSEDQDRILEARNLFPRTAFARIPMYFDVQDEQAAVAEVARLWRNAGLLRMERNFSAPILAELSRVGELLARSDDSRRSGWIAFVAAASALLLVLTGLAGAQWRRRRRAAREIRILHPVLDPAEAKPIRWDADEDAPPQELLDAFPDLTRHLARMVSGDYPAAFAFRFVPAASFSDASRTHAFAVLPVSVDAAGHVHTNAPYGDFYLILRGSTGARGRLDGDSDACRVLEGERMLRRHARHADWFVPIELATRLDSGHVLVRMPLAYQAAAPRLGKPGEQQRLRTLRVCLAEKGCDTRRLVGQLAALLREAHAARCDNGTAHFRDRALRHKALRSDLVTLFDLLPASGPAGLTLHDTNLTNFLVLDEGPELRVRYVDYEQVRANGFQYVDSARLFAECVVEWRLIHPEATTQSAVDLFLGLRDDDADADAWVANLVTWCAYCRVLHAKRPDREGKDRARMAMEREILPTLPYRAGGDRNANWAVAHDTLWEKAPR